MPQPIEPATASPGLIAKPNWWHQLAQSPRRAGYFLLLGHLLVFAIMCGLTMPGLGRYADMHELYAWSLFPAWGTAKHPPLLAWVTGLWFAIWPQTNWAFYVLAAANSTLAIYLVGKLARAVLKSHPDTEHMVFLVMTFCALTLSYGNMAMKLNMNSVLLPLWPLTAWAWVASIQRQTLISGILLGVAGGLSLLGKYYSGVLLLSLFFISIGFAQGRSWYASRAPYAALLACIVVLLPHALWVAQHDFITLKYVEEQSEKIFEYKRMFQLTALVFLVAIIAAPMLYLSGRPWHQRRPASIWLGPICAIVLLPLTITLLLAWIMTIQLSSPWAIPMSFAIPVAAALWLESRQQGLSQRQWLLRGVVIYWLLVFVSGWLWMAFNSYSGADYFYAPRQELAQQIEQRQMKLNWVGGNWYYSTALSFYRQEKIRAIPDLPAMGPAKVNTPANWQDLPGLMIFTDQQTDRIKAARNWLLAHGFVLQQEHINVARVGWQFLRYRPFGFSLIWACPKNQTSCPTGQTQK